MRATIKKRKRVKHTRFPNGFGSVVFLKGNRRRPYWARKTKGFNDNGYPIYLTIGYYETFDEAFVALCEYNHEPYDVEARSATFKEVSDRWYRDVMQTRDLSASSIKNYKYSCKKCEPLYDKKIAEISLDELQNLVSQQSAGMQALTINYLHQVFQYAFTRDIVKKDSSRYLHKTAETETKRNPFTAEEVRAIWNLPESEVRNKALIMLYTGMRVGEFETISEIHENYIIAGEKTAAGKNRIIPLHTKIRPLIDTPRVWTSNKGVEFKRLFPNHSPHDCRRTFISRCVECGIDGTVARKITGHAGKDVHENIYTFLNDPDFLCREIEKIYY